MLISDAPQDDPWPTELKLNPEKNTLVVAFTDGFSGAISAELLRVMSPSAEVQGHSPEGRKLVPGKKSVLIKKIEPVGNYAVKLTFDDGHDTGLYSWVYLHHLIANRETVFQAYASELQAAGHSR